MARDSRSPSPSLLARHALSPSATPSCNSEPEMMDLTTPSLNGAAADLKETSNKEEHAHHAFVPPPLSFKQEIKEMNGLFMNNLSARMAYFQTEIRNTLN